MNDEKRNRKLQELCRGYLLRLRPVAEKFGLGKWVDGLIAANIRNECAGTQEEVEMLSRCIDEERITRGELPKLLGKSYRHSFEDEDFENVKKLRHVGIYSNVDALLYKESIQNNKS